MQPETMRLLDYHFPDLRLKQHAYCKTAISADSSGTTIRCIDHDEILASKLPITIRLAPG
jgi:hypothetical protein